ncbi:hypothetical protein PFISCL1PPCAC_25332 [Pristionchus fissidentatus]|uniref:phosphoribosylglycinamide formyltransferase 1 n=1 Tax=Pristionchus fissidentatus TaxID=1538716 RepID=A0AAV5WTZ4_9BILA|nr:hypothetical protein PFISCL1PPCAC_25332 [Pristionchus fissidentatus]
MSSILLTGGGGHDGQMAPHQRPLGATGAPNTLPQMQVQKRKCRVAVLISSIGSNMRALIEASREFDSHFEVMVVISNEPAASGLEAAREAGVPFVCCIPHTEDRVHGDMRMHKILEAHAIDLICCSGFMRILSKEFVSHWHHRIVNVHPALLPAFKGSHAIRDALEAGVHMTGCTVHYIEEEVDAGEIIEQTRIEIPPGTTLERLREMIQAEEHVIYTHAVNELARKMMEHDFPR